MGLLSRLTAKPTPAPAGPLWRRSAFLSISGGDETAITYQRGTLPVVLPSFVLDFVQSCTRFRELDLHLSEYAQRHDWGPLQVASLRDWLPKLIDAGLLISTAIVHAQCRAAAPDSDRAGSIEMIGFPTGGDRLPLLSRALDSFVENVQTHGREVDFLIADSSPAAEQRARFHAHLQQTARERGTRVWYAGETEKRRFAARIVERSGCHPEAVEFALFDPLGTGFTCGANRNALLLHGAGRMLCSVDDDVICRFTAPPKAQPEIALFAACDPYSRWLFADAEGVKTVAQRVDADFLAAHETQLGRSVGALLPADLETLDFRQVNDPLLSRFEEGPAQVRATFCGHAGDPGIPTSIYYLYYDRENLARLTASEAHYRSVFASRSVLTLTPGPSIGDASVSPGMAMGLDHRELLPPFFPVLHAEDFIFGATLWQCCPRAVLGHLPLAIAHEPAPGKPILLPSDLQGERRANVYEFAHLMRRLVFNHHPAPQANAAARMASLGRALAEIGSLQSGDFTDFLRVQTLAHEGERFDYLEKQLRENPDAPEFWQADVQALIDHARDALSHDDFDIPFDLKAARSPAENRRLMQRLIAEFGRLLQEWPAIVSTARDLREDGEALFVNLQP